MQTVYLKALMYETQYKDYTPDLVMYETLLEKNIPVIEFGSGTGRISFHLLQQGYRVFGIEKDEDYKGFFLEKLQERGFKKQFNYVTDITEVDEICNIIYPFNVLFHLSQQEVQEEIMQFQSHRFNKLIIETDNVQSINNNFQIKKHCNQNYIFQEFPLKSDSKIIIHNKVVDIRELKTLLEFHYSLYLHKANYLISLYKEIYQKNEVFPDLQFQLYGDFDFIPYTRFSKKLIATLA